MNPPTNPNPSTNAAPQLPIDLEPPKEEGYPVTFCRCFCGCDGHLYEYRGKFHLVDLLAGGVIEEVRRP